MVRDPLGFLWRYAVGMRSVPLERLPLALDALTFGELVHELLGRTIDALEPVPGFVRASRDEIETALVGAVRHVAEQWPLERPVPPALLWKHSLDEAARRGLRGLTIDETFEPDTTSWSEVGFGLPVAPQGARAPWPLGERDRRRNRETQIGRADRPRRFRRRRPRGSDIRLQDRGNAPASRTNSRRPGKGTTTRALCDGCRPAPPGRRPGNLPAPSISTGSRDHSH